MQVVLVSYDVCMAGNPAAMLRARGWLRWNDSDYIGPEWLVDSLQPVVDRVKKHNGSIGYVRLDSRDEAKIRARALESLRHDLAGIEKAMDKALRDAAAKVDRSKGKHSAGNAMWRARKALAGAETALTLWTFHADAQHLVEAVRAAIEARAAAWRTTKAGAVNAVAAAALEGLDNA